MTQESEAFHANDYGKGHVWFAFKVGTRKKMGCVNCGVHADHRYAKDSCPNPGEWDHTCDEEDSNAR